MTATRIVQGAERGDLTAWYRDEFRQPAMAADIAEGLWAIADLSPKERHGVWHLPGPERLSRHQIALRYAAALDIDPPGVVATPTPISACRPSDIRMRGDRARTRIDWSPASILR